MARAHQNKGKASVREAGLPAGYVPRSGSFPSQWEPSVGDTLNGKIADYRTIDTKFGESDVVTIIETGSNLAWSVFISAGLAGRIKKTDKGARVFLRRLADRPSKKKGRSPMKAYIVGIAK